MQKNKKNAAINKIYQLLKDCESKTILLPPYDVLKEQQKIKSLLRDCKQLFVIERSFMVQCTRLEDLNNIISRLDDALGESEV